MATKYKEIFDKLAAPFPLSVVKQKPGAGGRKLDYITDRHCAIRFDEVLGPENWDDTYEVHPGIGVTCRLTITLPDGKTLTKMNGGGFEAMTSPDDTFKSGFSNAFRRAAVRFGVGRYLYKDGAAVLTDEEDEPGTPAPLTPPWQPTPPQTNGNGYHVPTNTPAPRTGSYPDNLPKSGGAMFAWAKTMEDKGTPGVVKFLDEFGKRNNLARQWKEWPQNAIDDSVRAACDHFHITEGLPPRDQANGNGGAYAPTPTTSVNTGPATGPGSDSVERPADGRGMFKLCKGIEEAHGVGVLESVNSFIKATGVSGRMTDWQPGVLSQAYNHLCAMVARFKSEGRIPADARFGAPSPGQTPQYDAVRVRAKINAAIAEGLSIARRDATDSAIAEDLEMLIADAWPGRKVADLATDAAFGTQVLKCVEDELIARKEFAATGVGCPA